MIPNQRTIMYDHSTEAKYCVAFSQPHAIDVADIDGDGLKDIVVGKRRWTYGPNKDIEPGAAPVLYWFQLERRTDGDSKRSMGLHPDVPLSGCTLRELLSARLE